MVSNPPQTGIEDSAEEFTRGRGDGDAVVLQPSASELASSRDRRKPVEATGDTRTERRGIPARILVAGSDLLAGALASALEVYGFATKHIVPRDQEMERGIEWCPNLVILDVRSLDVVSGMALIDQLRRPPLQVCVIDAAGDADRLNAWMGAGTSALIDGSEPFDQLFRTINRLLRRASLEPTARRSSPSLELTRAVERPQDRRLQNFAVLTERERVVLAELMEGHCAEEIATAGFVSISTVRSQIKAILQKLGVNSQLAAVALARRADWSLDYPEQTSPRPSSRRTHAF
jgi:two-component system, NarL family, nitrate/nitrite response regulator NarL